MRYSMPSTTGGASASCRRSLPRSRPGPSSRPRTCRVRSGSIFAASATACWPPMPAPASSSAASSRTPRAHRWTTACWRWGRRIFRAWSPAAEPGRGRPRRSALDLPPAAVAELAGLAYIALAATADHEGLAVFTAEPVAVGDRHVAHDLGETVASGVDIGPFDGTPDRADLDSVPQRRDLRDLIVGAQAAARVRRLGLQLRDDVDLAARLIARQAQQRLCRKRPCRHDAVARALRGACRQERGRDEKAQAGQEESLHSHTSVGKWGDAT